jgi:glycosyltransferase involved in cell wall biosynthesis
MKIGVLTSLYPSAARPSEGVFAERRWNRMRQRGHTVRVVRPVPLSPWYARWLSQPLGKPDWRLYADFPAGDRRGGVDIAYPRYAHRPWNPRNSADAFALAGLRALCAGHGGFETPRPDVVVLDYAWPAGMAAPYCGELRLPCVISGRGSDVLQVGEDRRLAPELARALRAAGHWCGVSRDLVRRMDELAGQPGRGVLVENGVDRELFQPRERGAARAELGLEPASALVLVVGHLIPRKDPLLALDVFLRGAPADARAVFIGAGELAAALAARIRATGAERRVRIEPALAPERLATWYAACDLLLLTSTREGRPNVVIEALACGRPVLATRAGGSGELLETLPECLCDARAPDVLGARLSELLAHPPDAARCVAAVAALDWDKSCVALESCLQAAVTAGRAG